MLKQRMENGNDKSLKQGCFVHFLEIAAVEGNLLLS